MVAFQMTGIFALAIVFGIPILLIFLYLNHSKATAGSRRDERRDAKQFALEHRKMDLEETKEANLAAQKEREMKKEEDAESREELIEEYIIKEELQKAQIAKAVNDRIQIIKDYGTGAIDRQYGQPILNVLLGFSNQLLKVSQDELMRADQVFKLEHYKEQLETLEIKQTKMQEKLGKAELKGSKRENKDIDHMKNAAGHKNKGFLKSISRHEKEISNLIKQKQKFEKKEEKDEIAERKATKKVEKAIQDWEKELKEAIIDLQHFAGAIQSGNTNAQRIQTDARAFRAAFKSAAKLEAKVFKEQLQEQKLRMKEIRDMEQVEKLEFKIAKYHADIDKALAKYESSQGMKKLATLEAKERYRDELLERASAEEARKIEIEFQKSLTEKQRIESELKSAEGLGNLFG